VRATRCCSSRAEGVDWGRTYWLDVICVSSSSSLDQIT
jgi:hypothetical protein